MSSLPRKKRNQIARANSQARLPHGGLPRRAQDRVCATAGTEWMSGCNNPFADYLDQLRRPTADRAGHECLRNWMVSPSLRRQETQKDAEMWEEKRQGRWAWGKRYRKSDRRTAGPLHLCPESYSGQEVKGSTPADNSSRGRGSRVG
jgi:hypothetical protein